MVINKTGASGVVGWTALKESKPDGYTMGIITTPSIVTKPIEGKGSFTYKDFTILANAVTDPGALNVSLKSDFKDLKSLVEYAKKNPKIVTVATGNFGGDDHLAMLKLAKLSGAKFTFVPFSGIEARNATMGGHVAAGSFNLGEAVNFRDHIRILGYMSADAIPLGKGIPTFKEQGYDVVSASQRGFAAPAGLSPEIAGTLQQGDRQGRGGSEIHRRGRQARRDSRLHGRAGMGTGAGPVRQGHAGHLGRIALDVVSCPEMREERGACRSPFLSLPVQVNLRLSSGVPV